MYPVLFWVSGHPVIAWTVCALIGVWAAYFSLSTSLARARIPAWQVTVFFLGCVAVWFAGAYGGQSLTVGRSGFHRARFAGYVLYGGVLATFVYGALAWRVLGWRRELSVQALWDHGAVALAWALFFGRIGCTLYGCCYGSPSGAWPGYFLNEERWDPQNHEFPAELRGVRLHPATLYEAAGLLLIIAALRWMSRAEVRAPGTFPPGVRGWICWIAYGVVRFLVEWIRADPRGAGYAGLSPSQCVALATIGVGLVMLPWEWRRGRLIRATDLK